MFNHRIVLKGFLLILALAVVSIVIVTAMKGGFTIDSGEVSKAPSFFEQFVIAGGPIVWFVLLPISLITVYLAVEYSLTIRRKRLLPVGAKEQIIQIINESNLNSLKQPISDNSGLVSIAASKAVRQGKDDWFRMRNAFAESLQEQSWALMRRIEWVNLIGNVSPMVGLFGTVFGMIKLFNAIVTSGGQPQPAQLADGISVALVTTFWGLFIAIPALAIFGIFRNRIETFASDAVVEMEEIIPYIQQRMEKRNKNRDQEQKPIEPNINQIKEGTSQESAETFSI
ncbi:MAG: MotA/TolQ/ExbB proton channel family protein [Planctomycetota bacterium]|jgi:biopolymer transport protein ExbB